MLKMARLPIIGVTSNYGVERSGDPPRERSYLLAAYTDAVFAAGGLPHPLPVPADCNMSRLDALLDSVDGVVFTGGLDVDPAHYGQAVHPQSTLLHPRRDRFEMELFQRADARRVPILAICLGFQIAHVARGGALVQHVDDLALTPPVTHHLPQDRNAFHGVRIAPGSQLAGVVGATELEVNSRHHQVVDPQRPGQGLRPVAWSCDGLVEGGEDCDGRFLLAVQWHPEDLIDRPEHLGLFQALIRKASGH